jgi:hypothetical protein
MKIAIIINRIPGHINQSIGVASPFNEGRVCKIRELFKSIIMKKISL